MGITYPKSARYFDLRGDSYHLKQYIDIDKYSFVKLDQVATVLHIMSLDQPVNKTLEGKLFNVNLEVLQLMFVTAVNVKIIYYSISGLADIKQKTPICRQ